MRDLRLLEGRLDNPNENEDVSTYYPSSSHRKPSLAQRSAITVIGPPPFFSVSALRDLNSDTAGGLQGVDGRDHRALVAAGVYTGGHRVIVAPSATRVRSTTSCSGLLVLQVGWLVSVTCPDPLRIDYNLNPTRRGAPPSPRWATRPTRGLTPSGRTPGKSGPPRRPGQWTPRSRTSPTARRRRRSEADEPAALAARLSHLRAPATDLATSGLLNE